ncbi:hypothetical protein [Nocardia brasiliensis]|uniref:hypothetical protein n=1 Tax=Nocardia brasiliensis TaxID=37326 RepID=UPI000569C4A4|nr:hypothetical protein [Nocardia brasiliensis]
MTEQPETPAAETSVAARICQFPTGFDAESGEFAVCGRALDDGAPRPGRKSDYCGADRIDPDGERRRHDRAGAFQRKRELQLAAVGKAPVQRERSTPRPVTSARASLADLLAQIEMVASGHREQMSGLLDRVVEVVAAAGDPDAAVAEVTSMRREAQAEVEAAQARADEAEAEAIAARRERDRALEDKELADGAAEDALAERDRTLVEAEQRIETIRAEAATEIESIRQAEAARVQAAEAAASAAQAEARAAEERAAAAAAAAEQARRDATEQVETLTRDHAARVERVNADADARVADSAAAQQRAESAAAAAEARAETARTELAQVRSELSAAREQAREDATTAREEIAELRRELTEVRAQTRTEREQQRTDHLAEIARVQQAAEAGANALQSALAAAENTITRLQTQLAETTTPKETH